jgi:fructose-1,6-bisphosphatase I
MASATVLRVGSSAAIAGRCAGCSTQASSAPTTSPLFLRSPKQVHNQSGSNFAGAAAALQGKSQSNSRRELSVKRVVAQAVAAEPAAKTTQKKTNQYEIVTLTGWLLKQEHSGVIDGELTIVLNSISLACKQIASLVQRAGISNLTGLAGAANVQGEDQKKLDVISNEVSDLHCHQHVSPLFLNSATLFRDASRSC